MLTKNQFGVLFMLTLFTCIWGFYLFNLKSKNPNKKYIFGECVKDYEIPLPIINRNWELDYEKCLDGWSVNHFTIYMITGILFPSEYSMVFLLSIACEILEILGRSRGRLSDVIINFLGYFVGSYISGFMEIKVDITNEYKSLILPCFILAILVFLKISKKRMEQLDKIKIATWKE